MKYISPYVPFWAAFIALGMLVVAAGVYLPAHSIVSAATAPTLSVSPSNPQPGQLVQVSWDAGSAHQCIVLLTDDTRTKYSPWGLSHAGSAQAAISSNTTFGMTCLDTQGAYVTPTPTVEVWVHPKLTVSKSLVPPGEAVDVSWYAGNAYQCIVRLSDATRTNYSPWGLSRSGSAKAVITSDTIFSMTCLDAVGAYVTPTPTATVRLSSCNAGYTLTGGLCAPTPTTSAVLSALSALNAKRTAAWASNHSPWEVDWEGNGDPSHDGPTWQWWSQPYSDDWEQPWVGSTSFAFDTPEPGFFTLDRTAERDVYKPGLLVRYDPLLGASTGLTLEFRTKLYANSAEDAFNVIYSMGGPGTPTVELFLSPGKIIAGGMNEQRLNPNPPMAALDTTQWHTYRMVVPPGENRVYLFVDGNPTPLLSAAGNTYKSSYLQSDDVPYIMVGSHFAYRPAHAVIDFVRYTRGAVGPASGGMPAAPVRTPPSLPPFATGAVPWTAILDGWSLPQDLGYKVWNDTSASYKAESQASWKLQGGGVLEFNSVPNTLTHAVQLQLDPPAGLSSSYPRGPYTVEFRAKVLPDSTERGFGFTMFDAATGFSLVLSPNKVETYLGWKPAGFQAYAMDTTDAFHTYRFVHPDQSVFGYLYIDDSPVPALVDSPGSNDGWAGHHTMQFGTLTTADLTQFASLAGHALVDYLRVSPTAYAPAFP